MAHKAVFLDRDDTIVDDPGYIRNPEQLRLIPGAAEALKQLKKMGYLLVIVTNQSGVARGFLTEDDLDKIHQELKRKLTAEGAEIDGLYYCPYHPDGDVKDFSIESNLRKPNAGMLFQAEEELNIDLKQSWMIGDSYRDIQAGKAAGCKTILVDVPGKIREKKKTDPEPDRKAVNLREAVNIIRMHEFHQKATSVKKTDEKKPEPKEVTEPSEPEPVEKTISKNPESTKPVSSPQTKTEQTEEDTPTAPDPTAEIENTPTNESQSVRSEPAKVYTAKSSKSNKTEQHIDDGDETRHLLEEIALRLRHKDREGLYQEFSVFKLLAFMVQAIAVLCLVFSICLWLSPKDRHIQVQTMIGFTVVLQLIVITLLMMHSRD